MPGKPPEFQYLGHKKSPSAQPDVNVPEMLKFLIENEVYKEDYENITARILEEDVSYDVAIEAVKKIAESGMFE